MSEGTHFITIPRHNPVNAITMGGIVKDAGLTITRLKELLGAYGPRRHYRLPRLGDGGELGSTGRWPVAVGGWLNAPLRNQNVSIVNGL